MSKYLDLLEKRPFGFEIEGVTSPSLYLVKARLNDETLSNGDKIELPSEKIGQSVMKSDTKILQQQHNQN